MPWRADAASPPGVSVPVSGVGLLGGAANVILQLSHRPVGYGVKDSRVESGQLFRHPVKRTRTTLTYLAVALLGHDGDRRRYRQAVDRSHADVHSRPGDPVPYNAFDRDLQLWVAACLYYGLEDTARRLGVRVDDPEGVYQACAVLGTTLQVQPEQWPADRAAFEDYWQEGLAAAHIDDDVRAYLDAVAGVDFLPWPVPALLGRFHRWVTAGLLPPAVRAAMGYGWSESDERRLGQLFAALGALNRRLPGPLQRFPLNVLLWDARLRAHLGLPLV